VVTTHRTIIESPEYEEQLARIEPDVRNTDLVHESFTGSIASHAEFFPTIAGTRFRYLRTRANLGGCPSMWVYFTIDDPDHCTLRIVVVAAGRAPDSIFRDDP
jgi:hypothetical protein